MHNKIELILIFTLFISCANANADKGEDIIDFNKAVYLDAVTNSYEESINKINKANSMIELENIPIQEVKIELVTQKDKIKSKCETIDESFVNITQYCKKYLEGIRAQRNAENKRAIIQQYNNIQEHIKTAQASETEANELLSEIKEDGVITPQDLDSIHSANEKVIKNKSKALEVLKTTSLNGKKIEQLQKEINDVNLAEVPIINDTDDNVVIDSEEKSQTVIDTIIYMLIALLMLVTLFIILSIAMKKKRRDAQEKHKEIDDEIDQNTNIDHSNSNLTPQHDTSIASKGLVKRNNSTKASKINLNSEPSNKVNVEANINNENLKVEPIKGDWIIFEQSLQGRDHLRQDPPIPCQDNKCVLQIDKSWGVAVVCDGAGSQKYSHHGSKFVSEYIANQLKKGIQNSEIYKSNALPDDQTWNDWCKVLILNTRKELEEFANSKKHQLPDIAVSNMGCTVIIAVYSPLGILIAHVGDGRAGYRDENGWHSMMTPFNGEYANQTVFINSDYIYKNKFNNPSEPDKPYLETRVIRTPVKSFVLMSDGCEKGLYRIDEYDEETKKALEINKPIDGFDKIIDLLNEKLRNNSNSVAHDFFVEIMREGNDPLKEEGDDKTLILAYKNIG